MKRLGLGMMRLPLTDPQNNGSVDMKSVCEMVDLFLKKGFTYFDTAYMYHDGQSECVVKKAITDRYPRESFLLASKMPVMRVTRPEDVPAFFEEQKEKCGVSYFDYYLLHNLNRNHYKIALDHGVFDELRRRRDGGQIRHLGFSFHDTADVLDKILSEQPDMEFVQLQINYLDWDDHKVQSRLCYETARKHGKKIIIMEPVKGGTLARLPENAEKLLSDYAPGNSPASYALRFAAEKEGVMMVLSGMSDRAQLEDNMKTMDPPVPLSEQEEKMLEGVLSLIRQSYAIPCTACSYCTEDCPRSIPTPALFKLYNAHLQALNEGKFVGKEEYAALTEKVKASDCIECGVCESRCPQHIGIIRALKRVRRTFE